jgi:hypothetical protein
MALVPCVRCTQPFYASCHDASCIDAPCPMCEYGEDIGIGPGTASQEQHTNNGGRLDSVRRGALRAMNRSSGRDAIGTDST